MQPGHVSSWDPSCCSNLGINDLGTENHSVHWTNFPCLPCWGRQRVTGSLHLAPGEGPCWWEARSEAFRVQGTGVSVGLGSQVLGSGAGKAGQGSSGPSSRSLGFFLNGGWGAAAWLSGSQFPKTGGGHVCRERISLLERCSTIWSASPPSPQALGAPALRGNYSACKS